MILSQSERNIVATSRAYTNNLSTQQNQVDKVMEEYSHIFSSPTGVPLHYQVKHPINLTQAHHYLMGQSTAALC